MPTGLPFNAADNNIHSCGKITSRWFGVTLGKPYSASLPCVCLPPNEDCIVRLSDRSLYHKVGAANENGCIMLCVGNVMDETF
jgi:hypothetical protein